MFTFMRSGKKDFLKWFNKVLKKGIEDMDEEKESTLRKDMSKVRVNRAHRSALFKLTLALDIRSYRCETR